MVVGNLLESHDIVDDDYYDSDDDHHGDDDHLRCVSPQVALFNL